MEVIKGIAREFRKNKLLSMDDLVLNLQCSERKVRYLLKELRSIEIENGFTIKTIRNKGYKMVVTDRDKYDDFMRALNELSSWDQNNQQERANVIIVSLLLTDEYITIEELSHILDVSISTVKRDIKLVKKKIEDAGLSFEARKNYGLSIKGNECTKRDLFKKFILDETDYENLSEVYWDYIEDFPIHEVKKILGEVLPKYEIEVSCEGISTLIDHITVMLYRLEHGNIISNLSLEEKILTQNYLDASEEILILLSRLTHFTWNDHEVKLLAVQILGRSRINDVPPSVNKKLDDEIRTILEIIDKENETELSRDKLLINALLHHVYLLMIRITLRKELKNPIRSMIPIYHMNAVLLAVRFINLFNLDSEKEISLDEIGYIALHFATHFERKKHSKIRDVSRIIYVSSDVRSSAQLNLMKIQNTFPNARVVVKNTLPSSTLYKDSIDLIITDIEDFKSDNNKVFYIDSSVSDENISRIKNYVSQDFYTKTRFTLEDLFFEEIYFYEEEMTDYFEILKKYSMKMIETGFADGSYYQEVLEREKQFSTIYDNGIAGPHSINQNAKIDSIGLIHLKNEVMHGDKIVKTIFMINLKKGHIFLYQDVSDLILWAIENHKEINEKLNSKDFVGFLEMLKERR